jgi:hypothetical protein
MTICEMIMWFTLLLWMWSMSDRNRRLRERVSRLEQGGDA